jgi:hypothetical protein
VTGLEPAASGVTGQRSNRLSYTPSSRLAASSPAPGRCQPSSAGRSPPRRDASSACCAPAQAVVSHASQSGRSSAVEHGVYTAGVGGSNPSARTIRTGGFFVFPYLGSCTCKCTVSASVRLAFMNGAQPPRRSRWPRSMAALPKRSYHRRPTVIVHREAARLRVDTGGRWTIGASHGSWHGLPEAGSLSRVPMRGTADP